MHFSSISPLCFMLMGNPFWFSFISFVIKLMVEVINFTPKLPYRLLCTVMKCVWIHLGKNKALRMKGNLKIKLSVITRSRKRFCRVMGCWYPLNSSRTERKERRCCEAFFRVGFLTLKKNMSAPTPTHLDSRRSLSRTKREEIRRPSGCVCVPEKLEKSTGCVGSRARLMDVLGI